MSDALTADERAIAEKFRADLEAGKLITISRAQYEALMAAAKALVLHHEANYAGADGNCVVCEGVIKDLRAAGIQIEGK